MSFWEILSTITTKYFLKTWFFYWNNCLSWVPVISLLTENKHFDVIFMFLVFMVFLKNWPCATIMHMTKSTWWPIRFETLRHAFSMFLFTQNQRMKLKKRLRRGNHHPSHSKKAPIVPLTMNLILSRMFAYNLSLFLFFFFSPLFKDTLDFAFEVIWYSLACPL